MKQWKVVAVLLALWVCVLLYITSTMPSAASSSSSSVSSGSLRFNHHIEVAKTMSETMDELKNLRQQNAELQQLIDQLRIQTTNELSNEAVVQDLKSRLEKANQHLSQLSSEERPRDRTLAEEKALRKTENTVRELWFFLQSQLVKLIKKENVEQSALQSLKSDLDGYKETLTEDLETLRTSSGANVWRQQRSHDLGDLVQRRLEYIQNPPNCSTAKKVSCNLHKGCGFGCQLHHVAYCLITAYALRRTLVLESKGWRYAPKGWETVFQPLSHTCLTKGSGQKSGWMSSLVEQDQNQVIDLPIVDSLHPRPEFIPLAVPQDLANQLEVFHGNPSVWWIGQVIKYLMRLNPRVEEDVQSAGKKMGFQNTIVGIHIRRTDKINLEAAFHSLDEYMVHVEEFYKQLERKHPGKERRVYLASDDSSVLQEARAKYPNYKFISDNSISKSAALGTRYSDGSLLGVIIDIYMLSRCDFLVCTFSSQVCRVAYELMQTYHGDASHRFRSLDDVFYFGGQNAHNLHVLEPHTVLGHSQIELKPGDKVGIAGNHWDGFSKGTNRRTGKSGLFPSYKVEDAVVKVAMPTYPEVPLTAR